MNIDFDKVKIIKKLGAGMLGTTYLVTYNNKKYALKIQHILEHELNENFKNELWRELDLYKYINKLKAEEKLFFTQLHDYKIYNNCKHKQERPIKLDFNDTKNEWIQKFKKLDESPWCSKYLLDYKGTINLYTFLVKHTLTPKIIYSLMIQICNITNILYKGGYSHNDLHPANIMINKTKIKYFLFNDKKIPTFGYLLTAIDYGKVLHKKFEQKDRNYIFLNYKDFYFYKETLESILYIINNQSKIIFDCKQQNKNILYNINYTVFFNILKNYPDFYLMIKNKYITQYDNCEKIFDCIMNKINTGKSVHEIIMDEIKKNNKCFKFENVFFAKFILFKIGMEFALFFPKKISEYCGWCSSYDMLLPKEDVQQILLPSNYNDLVNVLIDNLNKIIKKKKK
jgi:serine/threonine protein kinase